ncbi:hypothetical protein CQW23_28321 [Capsicum baccatum]|uniref:Protein kinase domain-containing protein n=1 Tax=Capsicum baccatum TaxID=33114 RepID=A0A2G2VG76_CAPBA|nr:hypothetical protein CQW23_28321 [Capsicum baccatum]
MHNHGLVHTKLRLENLHISAVDKHIKVGILGNVADFNEADPADNTTYDNMYRRIMMIAFDMRYGLLIWFMGIVYKYGLWVLSIDTVDGARDNRSDGPSSLLMVHKIVRHLSAKIGTFYLDVTVEVTVRQEIDGLPTRPSHDGLKKESLLGLTGNLMVHQGLDGPPGRPSILGDSIPFSKKA